MNKVGISSDCHFAGVTPKVRSVVYERDALVPEVVNDFHARMAVPFALDCG